MTAGTVKCCITPGRSQNRTSTYSTSSSEMYLRTSSELLNTLACSFDRLVDSSDAMGGMLLVGHSAVSQRLTASQSVATALTNLDCNHGRLARFLDARDARRAERTERTATIRRAARPSGLRCGLRGRVRPPAGRPDDRLVHRVRHRRAVRHSRPGGQPLVLVVGARGLVRPHGRAGRAVRCERRDDGCSACGWFPSTAGARSDRSPCVLRTALIAVVVPAARARRRRPRLARPRGAAPWWCGRASAARRTVRWTLRIFAPAGSGPFGIAAAREPSAARRFSMSSIWLVRCCAGAW